MSYYHTLIKSGSVSPYTARTTAFIAATGISDTTIIDALNTMDLSLISAGLDTKMKALYPFVGASASTHKYNFMDARDLDAAFRLTFNGGWTHSSTGAKPNGTNAYADTYFIPLTNNIVNSSHMSYYSRTLVSESKIDMGCYGVINGGDYNQIAISFGGTTYCNPNNFGGALGVTFSSNSQGFFIASRTSATNVFGQRNSVQTTGTSATARNENSIYLGALHQGVSTSYYATKECAFSSIGDGLTTTEASNFYTITQTFQTSLSRQVGVPIVSDSNAQAFLDAAIITDVTQANAVNQLVIDLKAASIWTKMKAVYPFVGGTASTHKFNLVNPVDSDAAFRLTFNGGWTHSSTGAKPNGTNAYADTKFNASTNFTITIPYGSSIAFSYYSRTNVAELGNDIGVSNNLAMFSNYSGTSYVRTGSNADTTYATTDSLGLFMGSRLTSSTQKAYKNGVLKGTSSLGLNIFSNLNIYLGAWNPAQYYSTKECAFSHIGDGLSDTEAANLYTAVQNFNTTLSRQV